MGKSGEWFMQTREMEAEVDDTDYQYFEWLSNAQWQDYVTEMENKLHKKYGYGATFQLKWAEFLTKNHEI